MKNNMQYDYSWFKEQFFKMTKIDLDSYKENQMKRRIEAFIRKNKETGYDGFYQLIKTNDKILSDFITYLTINVSEFYRNPGQWDLLENDVLPYLFSTFGKNLRIWSAACSTGDEPYTLAMLLSKYISLDHVKIIATDIDNEVLKKAKLGIYNEKSIKGLPEAYIQKHFRKEADGNFVISDTIKRSIEFKQHDLLRDEYPKDCDMIICRNVLIYFTEAAKNSVYQKFTKAQKNGGILFVGSTEQMMNPGNIGYETFRSFFYRCTK